MLSVITVNLNHAEGLRRTMQSVFLQNDPDIEYLVIDGGSTDGSQEVIAEYEDKIYYWVSEKDGGIYQAMNKALQHTTGEFVYFLNSGDEFANEQVSRFIVEQFYPSVDLVYGNTLRPDASGTLVACIHPSIMTMGTFWKKGICQQAIVYRKNLFEKLGLFDESFRIAGDWDFNVRVLLSGGVTRFCNKVIAVYEGGGVSVAQKEIAEVEKERLFKRHIPQAIYLDYLTFRELQSKMKHHNQWITSLKSRSLLLNLMMILKWKVDSLIQWVRNARGKSE